MNPGDIVHSLDEREYRVLRINPHSSTVVLRRVDATSNQRSFMRPSTSVCLLPSSTRDASVECNEPTDNCMCELTPPPVLPDVNDGSTQCNLPDVCAASTQCDFEADSYAAFKSSRFDSVDRLVQGFEEAKFSANAAFKDLCNQVDAVNELKAQVSQLQQRIATLNDENEALLKRTFELTEDVSTLTAITSTHRHLPALQRMFFHHLQQLPLTTNPNEHPHKLLFHVVGCAPSSSPEIIQENIKCLLQQLHPDKNPSVPSSVSQYVPLVTMAKTILLNKNLLPTYRCCGMFGVTRQQNGLRTCRKCDPFLRKLDNLMDL